VVQVLLSFYIASLSYLTFYRDTVYCIEIRDYIVLTWNSTKQKYVYYNTSFFPLDGRGWGNEVTSCFFLSTSPWFFFSPSRLSLFHALTHPRVLTLMERDTTSDSPLNSPPLSLTPALRHSLSLEMTTCGYILCFIVLYLLYFVFDKYQIYKRLPDRGLGRCS
jgi:hypothetical protein